MAILLFFHSMLKLKEGLYFYVKSQFNLRSFHGMQLFEPGKMQNFRIGKGIVFGMIFLVSASQTLKLLIFFAGTKHKLCSVF